MSIEAHSGVRGIFIGDRKKELQPAVYAYYEKDEIRFCEGSFEEVKAKLKEHNKEEENDKRTDKAMAKVFILYLGILIGSIVFTVKGIISFFELLAVIVFLIGSYVPLSSLTLSRGGLYGNKEVMEQFRRNHGAEHKLINCIYKEIDVNEENLKKESIYAKECGNVYTSTIFFYFLVFLAVAMNIGSIGILKSLAILVILPVVLFFNFLNPYNPFRVFQKPAIAEPTERELKLALALYEKASKNIIQK